MLPIMNFKLTLNWLARWKILWWFLVAIAGSVLIADWLGCRAEIPRHERLPYAGWFLDMLGVAVVFLGIAERLVLFEKDGLLARAKKLLREFPLFRRNVHIAAGSAKLSLTGGRASVRTTVSPPAGADIEERLVYLETLTTNLNNWLDDAKEQMADNIDELKRKIDTDIKSVRHEIEKVGQQSEKAHLGKLGWEYAGLGWIMVGLTLATVPKLVVPVVELFEWIPCW